MHNLLKPALLLYIAFVVLVNIGFTYLPIYHTSFGSFAPMALVVGGLFVLRDYAQRSAGHWVFAAMAIGAILSYFMAAPYVAVASAMAFIASELVDWAVYTGLRDKATFGERILLSSIISAPVDSLVFLFGIGAFSIGTLCIMIASKLVVAIFFFMRETRKAEEEEAALYDDGHWSTSRPTTLPEWKK